MTSPTVIGHPASAAFECYGYGRYLFGPDHGSAQWFGSYSGRDSLKLAQEHFGADIALRYYGYKEI